MVLEDVTISGVLFSLDPIRNPEKYIRGVFTEPHKVRIRKCSGRMLSFSIDETFTNVGYDFSALITSLTLGAPTNITYEICFSPKCEHGTWMSGPSLGKVEF